MICYEWLKRPDNVVAGHLKWSDYRAPGAPLTIKVVHHKTGTIAAPPLEEITEDGVVYFYAEAEEVLAKLPRLDVPMILRKTGKPDKEIGQPWVYRSLNHSSPGCAASSICRRRSRSTPAVTAA